MAIRICILILLLAFFSFQSYAQNSGQYYSYETKWKRIDELIDSSGLPKDALKLVIQVYEHAKKDKNEPQIIRALIYEINLQVNFEDSSFNLIIKEMESELNSAPEPAHSLLLNVEADLLWKYFQENRFRVYGRTSTANFKKANIETWGAEDFHNRISSLFLSSLRNLQLLQKSDLHNWETLLIKGNMRYLRPTLFDLLSHRALDYFKSDESDLNRPAYSFELDDLGIYAPAAEFATHIFSTKDSLSLHFHALQLFQELIRFHLHDSRPDAWIDVDLERLGFANSYAVIDNKEVLYQNALKNITDKYPDLPAAAEGWYLQAKILSDHAATYLPYEDSVYRYDYTLALKICERVISQKENSEGKSDCHELQREILGRKLSLKIEKVNIPYQPFRALVSYKNASRLYFRIIQTDLGKREALGEEGTDDFWKKLTGQIAGISFDQVLPETGDYQSHNTEIGVQPLPVGEYALVASLDKDFSLKQNPLAVIFFYVSNISCISIGNDYFVLNRETGKPLARTNVQAWYRYYDNKRSEYLERKGESFLTDNNGYFKVFPSRTGNNMQMKLEFSLTNDHLFIDETLSEYERRENGEESTLNRDKFERSNRHIYFFTDRSIYRPGQNLYFKGILLTRDYETKQPKILSGLKSRLFLYDVNGKKVDSLDLISNEFGSYHGQFRVPENRINGQFMLGEDSTSSYGYFSVEEYKRPKFFVKIKKPVGQYKIGDSIRIQGKALSYAAIAINGATIKYHVRRTVRIPYPWLFGTRGLTYSSRQEIAHGEIRSDDQGKFNISFPALPDPKIDRKLKPFFDYSINADVTDIDGETRSGENVVSVGYQSILISLNIPGGNNLPNDSLRELDLRTENLSGEFQPSLVHVSIYKLNAPGRLMRKRFWPKPDQFVMTREEFLKNFPLDPYRDENEMQTWAKVEKIFDGLDSTRENSSFNLKQPPFKPGWYLIDASTKDPSSGEEITDFKYVNLYDSKTGNPDNPQFLWTTAKDPVVQPGEKAIVGIGTSAYDVFAIQKITKTNSTIDPNSDPGNYSFLTLNSGKADTSIRITENDRGGISVNYAFVKNNRIYQTDHIINVPWSNKDLQISFETFRDKTLPGSDEKWKVKIEGYRKDHLAAELLTTMYDASLDQFSAHSWSIPGIYQILTRNTDWNGEYSFESIESNDKEEDYEEPESESFIKDYDEMRIAYKNNVDYSFATITRSHMLTLSSRMGSINAQHMKLPKVVMTKFTPPMVVSDSEVFKEDEKDESKATVLEPNRTGALEQNPGLISLRKNFSETAFFFPDLRTDSSGDVEFSFTMPEALTEWKWMLLAHTKDLSFGSGEKTIVTQKQMMVQPNLPRVLREGDHIYLSVKIANLTDSEFTGQVELQLLDATTNQSVDGYFQNIQPNQYFTVAPRQSEPVTFSIQTPYQFNNPVIVRIIARSRQLSDGEENILPVMSNRALVTETLPLTMNGTGKKDLLFQKLLASGNSETLTNQSLTVEYTSNPAWYVVQALPYLMEYPYECAEQTFNRFYANALASKIAGSSPRIKKVLEKWKNADSTALSSNLQKNEELKSILLQETPWVMEGKTESEQKKRIGLLLDMDRMKDALQTVIIELNQLQSDNGSFSWFKQGPEDRYITQYIVTGIGHLFKLNAIPPSFTDRVNAILDKAISYLDQKTEEDYKDLLKTKSNLTEDHLSPLLVQYLYARSYFAQKDIPGELFTSLNYFRKQCRQYWLKQDIRLQGMIALMLFHTGDLQKAKEIMLSLNQRAIHNNEVGMYWKENTVGYYWQQAPVETQSLMVEAFNDIMNDKSAINELKSWLLRQKETENWKTTVATADACYALMLPGTDWLIDQRKLEIRLGETLIRPNPKEPEAATGYFKKRIEGSFVHPEMGHIELKVTDSTVRTADKTQRTSDTQPSWGAVYWQYLEDFDKISSAGNSLKLNKKLFIRRNTDRGQVLDPLEEGKTLKVGDQLVVRIEIRSDRNMEYVHMRDTRASCTEPIEVLSGYKWQDGLGYYQTTKDASTDFFFNWLPKGVYIFEYPLYVTHAGEFTSGIAAIECMYAPEFSAHSEGGKIKVE